MGHCGERWSGSGRTVMPHKRIAIVAAMRRELAPLLRGVQGQRSDGLELFELENAVIAIGGIGGDAARRAATAVADRFRPAMLISAGIAGGLTAKLKVGDVVRASEVVDGGSGARFSATGGESVIVTVSSVRGTLGKLMLVDRYSADVVDMEAAAVAALARVRGIEFMAIKAISDDLEFEMPPMARFVDGDGQFKTARFAAYVAMRPKWWSTVRQLAVNSRVASVNLSHALEHLIRVHVNNTEEEEVPRW
jgi:adenosylhomocysteine nucleosidase